VRFPWRSWRQRRRRSFPEWLRAGFSGLFSGDLAFALDHFGVKVVSGQRQRESGGDVHADLLAQAFEHVSWSIAFEGDEHADFAQVRGGGVVHIRHNEALRDRDLLDAAQLLVFTDGGHVADQLVANGFAVGVGSSLEGFHFGDRAIERGLRGLAHEILELIVLGDEIGFRIHFDSNALGARNGDADEALSGGAARLLGGSGQTLGAQEIDSGFHVATGLVHCLFAIHHAGASALAQILHIGGSVSHFRNPS